MNVIVADSKLCRYGIDKTRQDKRSSDSNFSYLISIANFSTAVDSAQCYVVGTIHWMLANGSIEYH